MTDGLPTHFSVDDGGIRAVDDDESGVVQHGDYDDIGSITPSSGIGGIFSKEGWDILMDITNQDNTDGEVLSENDHNESTDGQATMIDEADQSIVVSAGAIMVSQSEESWYDILGIPGTGGLWVELRMVQYI